MTCTFIDSGVLIAAARGTGVIAERALAILVEPTSIFLKLEVLPFTHLSEPRITVPKTPAHPT